MSLPPNTILHNTPKSVSAVLNALKDADTIFFDCEGVDLGTQGGSITLLSFGTPGSPVIHLVHIPPIGMARLRPIFDLLESNKIQKVVFDGRMDQSALYYECGRVPLRNVVDLQLVALRVQRRGQEPGAKRQLWRLTQFYLPKEVVAEQQNLYRHVHKLPGLARIVEEFKLGKGMPPSRKRELAGSLDWSVAQLSDDHLEYAATDIRLISLLYAHAAIKRRITDEAREESAKYVALWITSGQPERGDVYRSHPLLPIGIIDGTDAPPPDGGKKRKASTLISTVLVSAVAVRGAAMEARQEETSASAESVPPIQSASTIISGSASASFSVPPIATTTPGAFASLGLYTTCLEFTFTQAPVPSVSATPLSCGADSSVSGFTASGTGVDTSVIPILSPTATASASVGTSVAVSGSVSASAPASSVSIMSTPLAVFSTCLLFFPSDTVTPTQSVSVTSLPSASASVSFSFTSSAVATSAASLV
ncbi:3'-5' exonuclease domain-containing protein [Mycena chlorophos]|uniref:3'-5' exonuclease domain-containing protein n=1 Tax=Mycena chlorophos TaxID=658473 RepID=A0A8H6SVZ7_MYCCL|nr:3'-5' exonuclease domain-containing protein [Mycena chlorophos]